MRPIAFLLCIAVLAGFTLPSLCQDDGDICLICPYCGAIYRLSPLEVAETDPFELCPNCGLAWAKDFVPFSCSDLDESLDDGGDGIDRGTDYETDSVTEDDWNEPESPTSRIDSSDLAGTALSDPVGDPNANYVVLMVVPPSEYQEDELDIPMDRFREMGMEVDLASLGTATAIGMNGGSVEINLNITDANLSRYDAVVFVGGMGIDMLRLYERSEYLDLAREAEGAGLVVGAICLAPKILANADLLRGRVATSSDPDYIIAKGADFRDQEVVRDGLIVSANGPEASGKFADALIEAMAE